jgi:hypothetical protein
VSSRAPDERAEWPLDNLARCRKTALGTYHGLHRPPRLADEAGAVGVCDLVFGGRAVFRVEPQNRDWLRVELLP